MKKIILTGLEEKYVENECPENIIYLGAWANIPESYHELLENIKKYKFRDLECSDNSELIEYCISVANSLLPIISRRMNKDLCLSHDIEFWDLVLSFWILLTVFVLFDRFVRIKIFVDKYKNEKCLIWLASGFAPSPHKGENLMEYYLDPAINHHIMSSIIGGMDVPNWTIKYIDVKRGYCNNDFIHCATPLVKIIFRKVKKYLLNVSNSILPKFGYYDTSYGPNYKDIILLKLISLFLNLKNTGNSINNRETKCDNYVRSLSDDFGLYVKKNIMGFLPTSYTEDFKKTYNHGEILFNKIKKYKYIVVDPFHSGEEEKKISYALYKKNGGKIIIVQHGAYYGTLIDHPIVEYSEYRFADKYFTWGWEKKTSDKFVGIPSMFLNRVKINRGQVSNSFKKLIFVTDALPLYQNLFYSCKISPEWSMSSVPSRIEFLSHLSNNIISNTILKAYPEKKIYFNQSNIIKKKIPLLTIYNTSDENKKAGDLHELIKGEARLVVMDYPGTTMHILLSSNVPCVFYWNSNDWIFTDETKYIMNRFKEVGILWSTGEEASSHILNNWSNIDHWWSSSEVQLEVKNYCRIHAKTGTYYETIRCWAKELNSIV